MKIPAVRPIIVQHGPVLLRFLFVGGFNTVLYLGLTAFFVQVVGWAPTPASVVAFTIAIPLAYAGHTFITFRSGWSPAQLTRFIATNLIGLALSFLAIEATNALGINYFIGALFVVVAVPFVSFLCMKLWVYREAPARAGTP